MPPISRLKLPLVGWLVLSLLIVLPLISALPVSPVPSNSTLRPAVSSPEPEALPVAIANVESRSAIPNRYLVVMDANVDPQVMEAKHAAVRKKLRRRNANRLTKRGTPMSSEVALLSNARFNAFILESDDDMIRELAGDALVRRVEAITTVEHQGYTAQVNAPIGLNRISRHKLTGDDKDRYTFESGAGSGVDVYVVDSGVRTTHVEFEGRAEWGTNTVDKEDEDKSGHGSHVAGTIAGRTYGVAKKAKIIAVKVLGSEGKGDLTSVLKGLNWVLDRATKGKGKGRKAVVNMSLGAPKSESLDEIVDELKKAGVAVVVAAGNQGEEAKLFSPASSPSAFTVGALDPFSDKSASFSNFGKEVDLYATGVQVTSVGKASDTASARMSGTSMASPHVAGLAAYLMALEKLGSVDAVYSRMIELAESTGAQVKDQPHKNTTKRIAYNGAEG